MTWGNETSKILEQEPLHECEQISALDDRLDVEVSHPVETLVHDEVHEADVIASKPFARPQKFFVLLHFLRQSA